MSSEPEEIIEIKEPNIIFKINKNTINNLSFNKVENLTLISKTKIICKNLTDEYVAFSSKTTKKINYVVNPAYYVFHPKEIKTIDIFFYLNEMGDINPKGHKFKFEGFIIPENEKNKNAKDLFSEYQQNKIKIKETIIKKKVLFIEDNSYIISNNSIDMDENKNIFNFKKNTNKEDLEHVEELENLKIEYYKLKSIIDNLKYNYLNMKKILELEQTENKNKYIHDIKYIYNLPKNKQETIPNYIFITCFIGAIIIGFYLTK